MGFGGAAGVSAVTFAFNLALLPFVLNRLGPGVYGAWATVATVLAIGGLADAGVRVEIIRRVATAKGAEDEDAVAHAVHEGVTILALLAGVILLFGFVLAPSIRAFAFPGGVPGYSAGSVDQLIRAVFGVLAASLVFNGFFGVLRGLQRGDVESVAQIVGLPVAAAVNVAGILQGWGLWSLLLGSAAHVGVAAAWQFAGVRRLVPSLRPRLMRIGMRAARSYLALSGLVLVAQVAEVVDFQWDKLVLSHFVGSTAVASFHVGTMLVLQAKALAILPMAPLIVAVAELRGRDEHRLAVLSDTLAKAGMVVAAVMLGGLFVFGPAFVRLWLGPDMAGAGTVVRLYVLAVAVNLLSTPLACRALGEARYRLVAAGAAINMVVNAGLSLGLTIAVGVNGPLYGSIAGTTVGAIFLHVAMRRQLGVWRFPPLRAAAIGAAMTAAAVWLGLDQAGSWPALSVAAVAFAVLVGPLATAAEGLPLSLAGLRRLSATAKPPLEPAMVSASAEVAAG